MNANESFFCQHEPECLGHWVTREHIKALPQKASAILNIDTPRTKKELRSFIGMVNHCRDSWIGRSDPLAPLSEIAGKNAKWEWTDVHQKAFENIKKVLAREVLLSYPDFNKPFEIYTDASDYQLGLVITQEERPIAFFS